MKKYLLIAGCIAALLAPSVVLADEGTITASSQTITDTVKVVKVSWTAAANGEASGSIGEIFGTIFAVFTNPGDGDDAPTDNYDIYLKDYATSTSLAGTEIENRDTANNEFKYLTNFKVYRPLGFSVSAAGAANAGEAWLYVEIPK